MPYLEIQPARANSRKPDKLWGSPLHVMEEKIDGWRFLMHLGGDLDRVYMTGRRTSVVTGLLSEKAECVPQIWPRLPAGLGYTVLDGEVTVPGGFRSIAGIMNVAPDKARAAIEKAGTPTFHVFDVLYYDGHDLRDEVLHDRRRVLAALMDDLTSKGAAPHLSLVPQWPAEVERYDEFIARGGEGAMVKDLLAVYGEGWTKAKRAHTLEVVVTGFTDAKTGKTGKYTGLVGAALVSVFAAGKLVEVGRVSGMTDDVRREMTANPSEWTGKVIEVECQEWARSRLRHPRYKRPRPDVDPRSATYAKLMRDLGREDENASDPDQLPLL